MVKVKVNGLGDLARALKALPPEIASKNGGPLKTALRAAAVVIQDDAKSRAPVDSGVLRDAISVKRDPRPLDVTERYVVKPTRSRRVQRIIKTKKGNIGSTSAWYWHFLEFGTKYITARPFMRPAFDSQKSNALQAFIGKLQTGIKRAAAKVARGKRGR